MDTRYAAAQTAFVFMKPFRFTLQPKLLLSSVFLFGFLLFFAKSSAASLELPETRSEERLISGASKVEVTPQPLKPKEIAGYPSHFRFNRVIEPVFGSSLFFLEAGDPNNPPLLLVHGLGDAASKDWLKVIPALERFYHVVAIDLPGFGLSKDKYFEYSPNSYSQVIEWFIDYKLEQPPVLIGHSMGAAISLYYAANKPKSIKSLVLIDAAGILERTSYLKQLSKLPEAEFKGPKTWSRLNSTLRNFGDKWVEKSGEFFDPSKFLRQSKIARKIFLSDQAGINAALAMIDTDFSRINFASVPNTLMIWGGKDNIAPLRTGLALEAKLPRSTLEIINSAGHVPMNSHSQQFNRLLLSYLAKFTAPTIHNLDLPEASQANNSLRIGRCKDDDFPTFRGDYHTITLNNCKLANLNQVRVKNFSAKKSFVSIFQSDIGTPSTIIPFHASVMTATASQFYGEFSTKHSRLDFAGVSFHSTANIITATDTTKLVFSISQANSLNYLGPVHGYYALTEGTLSKHLIK